MDAGTVPVTIALVEDDEEARSRLVASISRDPTLRLVGEYRNGREAPAGLAIDSVLPVEGDVGVVLGSVRHRMRSVFERAGVQLAWNVSELPRMDDLTPERIVAIQRIFLETFSNAIRHSGARTVSAYSLRVPGAVRIVIEDDGRGFDPASRCPGTGLANLQLRASQAGGTLSIESQPGKGTRVTLSRPLAGEALPEPLPSSGQTTDEYPVRGIDADTASA